MMKKLRVIIGNDQTLVSAAMRSFLETCHGMEVVGTVRIGSAARKVIVQKRPDLLFLYLAMRGYEGLEKAEKMLKGLSRVPSILLTANSSAEYVSKALRLGVNAVLPQMAGPGELKNAVRGAMRGGSYLSPKLPKAPQEATAFEKLTPRQRSVLKLMAEGNSTKEIATTLKLSAKTVEFHRARLMERLGIYDVPGLVRLAARVGLVSIDK